MSKQSSPSIFRRLRDFTWRGPSSRLLVTIAAVLILILFGLLAAGLAGLSQGVSDQRTAARVQVEEHLNNALAYLQDGQGELAAAEFEEVLRLDPSNIQAQQGIAVVADTVDADACGLRRSAVVGSTR